MSFQWQHIEAIRRNKYGIGQAIPVEVNVGPVVDTIAHSTHNRVIFELIQNAEDNKYEEGIEGKLEFLWTSTDITATGAQATLLVFNNENGFSRKNIESVCGIFESTKKQDRNHNFIGEQGLGFKSLFLVSSKPYIFSNGYKIRFNENPCPECGIPFIVPEWIEEKPTLMDIKEIYGEGPMPNTIIVLPLRRRGILKLELELSNINPECLLFLNKIRHISVRNVETRQSILSFSSDIVPCENRHRTNIESYIINLFAKKIYLHEAECSYLVWKQKFPINSKNMVKEKKDAKEWMVTLAFPFTIRQEFYRHSLPPGLFAFLPTQIVTKFPFIIQADFMLTSSKDDIMSNNSWNQGLLECVPATFTDAFKSFLFGLERKLSQPPAFSVVTMFKFLPFESSLQQCFIHVLTDIKNRLLAESIVPIDPFTKRQFCRPGQVSRLLGKFYDVLIEAENEGVYLPNLSCY